MLTDAELREIKAGVERCEKKHGGQEYPFCENYGCMNMRPLLDEIERLRQWVRLGARYAERSHPLGVEGDCDDRCLTAKMILWVKQQWPA